MHTVFRNAVGVAAISLALNAPVFADASHNHGHEAFAAKGEAHPHGTETGNVRTGDNSIEIYGKLYMSLGYSDPGPGVVEKIDLSSHGSFLGVRGNQPLNEALRLFWQIESAIDLDNLGEGGHDGGGNSSGLASRDSFVGLSGNAGTLLFGKHFTPLTMLLHANDPFAHLPGDARSMLGYVGHRYQSSIDSGHGTMFYVRAPNSIVYMSPDVGGFSTNIALIAIDESAAHGVRMPGTSLSLSYKIGSFNASYAFERHKKLDKKTSETLPDPSLLDMTQVHMLSAMYHLPTSTMVNFTVQKLEAKDTEDDNGEGADGDQIGRAHV